MFSRALLLCACAILSFQSEAQGMGEAQAQAITTVQELLQLDAETALNNERQRYLKSVDKQQTTTHVVPTSAELTVAPITTAAAAPTPPTAPEPIKPEADPEDHLSLLSIFGVGNQLRADVDINGHQVRFLAGRPMPIAGPPVAGYRLVSFKTPCVVLANARTSRKLCIQRVGEG